MNPTTTENSPITTDVEKEPDATEAEGTTVRFDRDGTEYHGVVTRSEDFHSSCSI
jgi:hypothetical protein